MQFKLDRARSKSFEQEYWESVSHTVEVFVQEKGVVEWWSNNMRQFPSGFVDEVDNLKNANE